MTFRIRVVLATTLAVAFAVLVSCSASYLSTRHAVEQSVDETLRSVATGPGSLLGEGETVTGVFYQIVLANGNQYPPSDLPVDQVILDVASGKQSEVIRTVYVKGSAYRELIIHLSAGTVLRCEGGPCTLKSNAAQVFSLNISGQQHQLHVLAIRLLAVALAGIFLAIALGFVAARASLRPLVRVTNRIEEVAESSDFAYRFEEGLNDELGRLRRVFNKLLTSIDSSQRLQRQLVLDASHELRTPLTSLRTNAQVLSNADRLTSDEVAQITDDMVTQVDELARLISDLAELSRGEGGGDVVVERIRLDDLVDECMETAKTHGRIRNVSIDGELSPYIVEGRRDRVARAVNNLLNNAIKFAPLDGHVHVTLDEKGLRVADDGPGVADEDLPFVFDRFWRSPNARALPGSGLGLAIVNQVALEMGGTVQVGRSSDLGGALFTLHLPKMVE